MFDKIKFSKILRNINDTYDTMTEFSKKSGVNRTYLSQYINQKLDSPPSPGVLMKIANNSHEITTYEELMDICNYFSHSSLSALELLSIEEQIDKLEKERKELFFNSKLNIKEYRIMTIIRLFFDKSENNPDFINDELDNLLKDYDEISPETKQTIKQIIITDKEYHDKINNLRNIKYNLTKSTDSKSEHQFYMCPVYGRISAGQPNWAEENIEGRIPVPMTGEISNPEECFYLKVNGESMNKLVKNGAYALIHKQDIVEDGEIAVVLVNGYDATLKKFSKQGDFVILEPMSDVIDDPDIKTQIYDNKTSIKILGKYIGKFEMNG